MSLDKFQATDAWRNKFKTHLFTERKTPILAAKPKTAATSQTPQRLSYQLSDELQVILEEKKIPRPTDREMPRVRVRDVEEEDKENNDKFHERLHASNTPNKLKRQPHIDNTIMNDSNEALDMTNTSFETLEKMCEKTASDPDSTLFKYLGHESPNFRHHQAPQRANRMRPPSFDEEADALERLLDELNVEETENRLKCLPMNDITQLDDIEAPSRFWENTMTQENLQSISPVKMVGLMRQSTIMEEYSDVSESEASSTSYQSAMKTCYSSETTGCYDTANDTAACSDRGGGAGAVVAAAAKKLSINSSGRSSSSDLFQQRASKHKFFNDEKKESTEDEKEVDDYPEQSIHLIDFDLEKDEDDLGESLRLIDLDTTVKSPPEDATEVKEAYESEDSNESIINSPSSEFNEQAEDAEDEEEYSLEPLKSSPESTAQLKQSDESDSCIIELSDDEESMACKNQPTKSENVLNRSFTIKSEAEEKPSMVNEDEKEEKSLHFNDTMEEVEYMMNKGMQYMQAAAKDNLQLPIPQQSSPGGNSKKSHLTPVKKFERYRSPSPMLTSPYTPKTVIAKPKPVNKHVLDIKPFPKLDLFKKPQGSGLKAPNKLTSSLKKQQYAHVVSPIGAYIKKTPTTPLLSSYRTELVGTSSSSASGSKAFRKLDCDSRETSGIGTPRPQNQARTLPKKAYISSDLKHIVDERTQYTIPGGPKIQRYLVSAMIPAVVRHEGKVKLPENLRTSDMKPAAPRRTDDSLADLSMVSGDVSVYTIKDAQKF